MIKEKKDERITVRLSSRDLLYLRIACYRVGLTPSKYIRMMIDTVVNQVKLELEKGDYCLEDYTSIFNGDL